MNFFLKGDFKIKESWQQKPVEQKNMSRQKSRQKQKNKSLVNAGKNIIYEPSPDILDDQMSKLILKDLAAQYPSSSSKIDKKYQPKEQTSVKLPPKQKVSQSNASNENDLIASMANRLKNVQLTCKNQRQEIKEKMETIEKLKAENAYFKGCRDNASQQYEKVKNIQVQNEEMKKKIEEMQNYLKKYGLKWVGTKIEGKLQHEQMKKDIKKPNYQYRLPSQIDINTILRRVQQLNLGLHSEGLGTEIHQQNGIHKFKKAEGLPVGFFSNGIAIKGYKFFPYKSKESLQILGDLIDGYFPYILKHKYPNGVFLNVVDKINEKFIQESASQIINTFETNLNNDFKPPSKEQFLSKLPKQVIKNGKVINIRGEIQKLMNGQITKKTEQKITHNESQYIVEDSQAGIFIFKTQEYLQIQNNEVEQSEICSLKIRNEAGKVYMLQLQRSKKMKDVYHWIGKINKKGFKVMGNYPRRIYEMDETQTLEGLGFYPNGMMHIQMSSQ